MGITSSRISSVIIGARLSRISCMGVRSKLYCGWTGFVPSLSVMVDNFEATSALLSGFGMVVNGETSELQANAGQMESLRFSFLM